MQCCLFLIGNLPLERTPVIPQLRCQSLMRDNCVRHQDSAPVEAECTDHSQIMQNSRPDKKGKFENEVQQTVCITTKLSLARIHTCYLFSCVPQAVHDVPDVVTFAVDQPFCTVMIHFLIVRLHVFMQL